MFDPMFLPGAILQKAGFPMGMEAYLQHDSYMNSPLDRMAAAAASQGLVMSGAEPHEWYKEVCRAALLAVYDLDEDLVTAAICAPLSQEQKEAISALPAREADIRQTWRSIQDAILARPGASAEKGPQDREGK